MRIAFPTNDKEKLFKRSGRAKGFLIVDVLETGYDVVDFRSNNHSHDHDHDHGEHEHHDHSHKEIVDALNDCRYLVVNVVGKHFGKDLKEAGIAVFKTDKVSIADAVEHFKSEA